MKTSASFLRLWLRLLTFRASREDYQCLTARGLFPALAACWLVGIGRYWDDARATLLQHAGIGSVVYVFVLALLLWIIVKPLAPDRFSYTGILTFIALTAPPAALYAIPVERWMSLASANQWNLTFLGIVALWRLALWIHYLRKSGELTGGRTFVAAVLPLAVIFITLLSLNLHHVVVDIMGGIREADRSSQDAAYGMLWLLSVLSVPLSAIAGIGWLTMVIGNLRGRGREG